MVAINSNDSTNYNTVIVSNFIDQLTQLKMDYSTCSNKEILEKISQLINSFNTCRVDIKNLGVKDNGIYISKCSDYGADIDSPSWFSDSYGKGTVIQSNKGELTFEFECINSGQLRLTFRGIDYRNLKKERTPIFIEYKSLKINDKNLLKNPIIVSHDNPYKFKTHVPDGKKIKLTVKWQTISSNMIEHSNVSNNDLIKKIDKLSEELIEQSKIIDSQYQIMNIVATNSHIKASGFLRKLQWNTLELLKFAINICNKYDFEYWLDFGSLIGAIRHNGFIPWDDEIDMSMPRKDFEKFINILPIEIGKIEGFNERIKITFGNTVFRNAKGIGKNHSPVIAFMNKNPISILEIYPCDFINIEKEDKTLFKQYISNYKNARRDFSKKYSEGMCTFDSGLLDAHRKVGIVDYETEFMGCSIDGVARSPIHVSNIYPLKKIDFEGLKVNMPNNPIKYLESYYRDVMDIPKVIHHHNFNSKNNLNAMGEDIDDLYNNSIEFLKRINDNF